MIKRIKIQEKRTMTREEFITLSKDHILYLDGATGSNLVKAGMPSGVCPEQWILEHQGVMLQLQKDYVQAARVIGVTPLRIMRRHVLPNVLGPVLVLATVQVATAIITEATLSFLGVGVPPTSPSLGTLIRTGNDFLFSGEWWITVFPGLMLVLIALSVNLLGDWLRDALNPRLR